MSFIGLLLLNLNPSMSLQSDNLGLAPNPQSLVAMEEEVVTVEDSGIEELDENEAV